MENFGTNMIIVLLGDFGAHIDNEVVENMIGSHGVPARNENGERMIELCID